MKKEKAKVRIKQKRFNRIQTDELVQAVKMHIIFIIILFVLVVFVIFAIINLAANDGKHIKQLFGVKENANTIHKSIKMKYNENDRSLLELIKAMQNYLKKLIDFYISNDLSANLVHNH